MKHIYDFLMKLGIGPKYTGFNYIVDLVKKAHECTTYSITKFYKEVGREHGVRWSSVERAVRAAVAGGLNRQTEEWYKYFEGLIYDATMTNKDFVAALSFMVNRGMLRLDDIKEENNNG